MNERESILLFKPKKDKSTIRKNSPYHSFKALCLVDKEDNVVEMGYDIYCEMIKFKNLDDYMLSLLTKSQRDKSEDDDYYRVYCVLKSWKFNEPYKLSKPVRGMRYSSEDETYDLKKEVIKTISKEYNITPDNVLFNTGKYPDLYRLCMIIDFQDVLFDLEKTRELYYS